MVIILFDCFLPLIFYFLFASQKIFVCELWVSSTLTDFFFSYFDLTICQLIINDGGGAHNGKCNCVNIVIFSLYNRTLGELFMGRLAGRLWEYDDGSWIFPFTCIYIIYIFFPSFILYFTYSHQFFNFECVHKINRNTSSLSHFYDIYIHE